MELAKLVISLAADLGTGIIAGDIFKNYVNFSKMSKAKKVLATVGASAMSLMASDAVSDYVEKKFDEVKDNISEFKKNKEDNVVAEAEMQEVENED